MRKYLQFILELGVKSDYDELTKGRLRNFNLDLVIGIIIVVGVNLASVIIGIPNPLPFYLFSCSFLITSFLVIYLNFHSKYDQAVTLISLFVLLQLVTVSSYYGEAAQIHFFLVILAITPITHLFENIKLGVLISALFPGAFLLLYFFDFNLIPIKNNDQATVELIKFISNVLFFPVFIYKILLIFKAYWDNLQLTKTTLKENKQERELYRTIFEHASSAILLINLKDLSIINANPNALKLFNWKERNLTNYKLPSFLPAIQPNGQDSFFQLLKVINRIKEKGIAHYDFAFQNSDGIDFHTDMNATQLPYPEDEIAVFILKDITAKKRSDDLLRSSEELFRKLYEESPLGIVMETDKDQRLIKFNSTFYRMLGYNSPEELHHLTVEDITHPEDLNTHIKDFRLLSIGAINSFNFEKRYYRKDGSILHGNVYLSSITNENGEYQDIAMIEDITEKKQSELLVQQKIRELNEKNEELQRYAQSNTELENFAYVASHDLREPLRTITGFSQLIQKRYESLLDKNGKEYLSFIIKATSYMETLVNDLLTYSRVNTQNYHEEEVNFKELLEIVTFSLHQSIKDNEGKIQFQNIPDIVYGDKSRLKQLFQNLIANAVKFKKPDVPPEIKVLCEEKRNHWQFRVSDNGIGIQKEYHEKIFQLFRKLHRKDEYEGSGIGLALCKKIVEQHGGKIWVESEYGKCTCFIFTIPKVKVKEVKITQKESEAIF